MCICMTRLCIHMYVYIYTYICREKERERESPPLGQGPLGPRIDWASRVAFAVLASDLNCEGNQASRSVMLVLNTSRLRARSCHSVG